MSDVRCEAAHGSVSDTGWRRARRCQTCGVRGVVRGGSRVGVRHEGGAMARCQRRVARRLTSRGQTRRRGGVGRRCQTRVARRLTGQGQTRRRGGVGRRRARRCQRRRDGGSQVGIRHEGRGGGGVRRALRGGSRVGVRHEGGAMAWCLRLVISGWWLVLGAAVSDTALWLGGGVRPPKAVWRQGGAPQGRLCAILRLGKDAPPS
ncbi:MAG: hypothetical protein LBK25_00705 [Treponema sp.]|nr:hypothetical protein [Treponema sp.]